MNTEAIRALEARYEAEIADLRAQLEAAGAGGVSGRLMGEAPAGLLEALQELRPMADYGRPGSRDVDQARYQQALDAAIAMLSAAPLPPTAQPAGLGNDERISVLEFQLKYEKERFAYMEMMYKNLPKIGALAALEKQEATQPQQSTPAVQPKIPPFIESMHSYKTVWTDLEAEQIEDYGRRCFAAGISAGQQPQQSAAINPTGGTT